MAKTKLEIERKFLLKKLPKDIKKYKSQYITQSYFFIDGIWQRFRFFQSGKYCKDNFIHTIKKKLGQGIYEETEKHISEKEYNKTVQPNAGGKQLFKRRYVLKYKKLKFEIDVYDKISIITLEVELPDMNHPIDFPPGLKELIIADVTKVKGFANSALAEKF